MITTYAQPYETENAGRAYPLADVDSGIPDGAIVDCRIVSIRKIDGPSYVTGMSSGADGVSVSLLVGGSVIVAHAAVGGRIAHGSIDGVHAWVFLGDVDGVLFSGSAKLCDTVVTLDTLKVRSLAARGGGHMDRLLSGPVHLAPGYNVDASIDGSRIRLDVARGAGLGEMCAVESSGQTCGGVMYSINGELPNSDGDIVIEGGAGISVRPDPDDDHAIEIRLDGRMEDLLRDTCA